MPSKEIKLDVYNTVTSKSYPLSDAGFSFTIKSKIVGNVNNYMSIHFNNAKLALLAYGENPQPDDFIDMTGKDSINLCSSGIMNTGLVRITIKGIGNIIIISK